MSLLEAWRRGWSTSAASVSCHTCAWFRTDVAAIEAALPGINSFSSAHASVRADDGLCALHDMLINGRRPCAEHTHAHDKTAVV